MYLRSTALSIIVALPALHFSPCFAHDPAGMIINSALPKEVKATLVDREKIRSSGKAQLLAGNLPRVKAKELVKSLKVSSAFESPEAVISARAIWPQRAKLRVCFFNGSSNAQAEVFAIFKEISTHTNIAVALDDTQCMGQSTPIRVSFQPQPSGYWSYVGTDATLIPLQQPTIGLLNLDQTTPFDENTKGIVRHEIMHAFAALHEHQSPNAKCEDELKWSDIAKELKWSEAQMRTNFRQVVFSKDIIASDYDKLSIMHYQLPTRYWKTGARADCYLPYQNTTLSPGDVAMLKSIYPK